jgi:hypothetical protein
MGQEYTLGDLNLGDGVQRLIFSSLKDDAREDSRGGRPGFPLRFIHVGLNGIVDGVRLEFWSDAWKNKPNKINLEVYFAQGDFKGPFHNSRDSKRYRVYDLKNDGHCSKYAIEILENSPLYNTTITGARLVLE